MSKHRWDPSRPAVSEFYPRDVMRLADNPAEAILRAEAEAVARENHALTDRYRTLNNLEEAQQDGRGFSRRSFVVGAAATVTALATTQFVSTRVSFGATAGGTLIHVFLYGGMDGLSVIAPSNDPYLTANRPALLLPEGDSIAIGTDIKFKLSKAFAPLQGMLKNKQVAFIPGVSDPRLSRSHFQAEDACNLGGLPAETGGRGFLDALIDTLGPGTAFRSVGIGSTLPRSLVGTNAALSLNTVGSLNLNGDNAYKNATAAAIEGLFTGINHPVEDSVKAGLNALAKAREIASTPYTPAGGLKYSGVGTSFREIAQLIKGGAQVRVATIGMGGYDTHERQGTQERVKKADGIGEEPGYLFTKLKELATAINDFYTDLGEAGSDVTVMVSTEFGRRVAQNGLGTDHGHGSVMIVATGSGKPLQGNVLGRWNGLDNLDNGDVPENNNLFDVFGSIMKGRFALTDAEVNKIFPSRRFTPVPIFA